MKKSIGVIAEYNPFHNGHLLHLTEARRLAGGDLPVIAVMSGSVVQRGETAFCNKWARAQMAVQNGVDLVLELPAVFSCRSAEFFAAGAVQLLAATGITDFRCGNRGNTNACSCRPFHQHSSGRTARHYKKRHFLRCRPVHTFAKCRLYFCRGGSKRYFGT